MIFEYEKGRNMCGLSYVYRRWRERFGFGGFAWIPSTAWCCVFFISDERMELD
jgi:hypothetical protein